MGPATEEGKKPIVLRIYKHIWDNCMQARLSDPRPEIPVPKEDEFECFACGHLNFVGEGHCRSCYSYVNGGIDCIDSVAGEYCSPTQPIQRLRKKSIDNTTPSMEKELAYTKQILGKINETGQLSLVKCLPREGEVSAMGSMPYSTVARHIISLRLEQIQRAVRPIIAKLMQHPRNVDGMFNRPVDPVALELPDYFTRVKHPMDLGTVRSKLQRGLFESVAASTADISLIFKNAMTYNPATHHVHQLAKAIKADFDQDVVQLDERFQKDVDRKAHHSSSCKLCQGEMCNLCGEKCLKFEPPVLVCHGSCMQRIKRNAIYYVTSDGIMLWCQKCYTALPQLIMELHDRPPVLKRQLLRCKSDEEVSEPWVSCDTCGKWVHMICGLYNDRFSDGEMPGAAPVRYECPKCKLEAKSVEGKLTVVARPVGRPRGRQPKIAPAPFKPVSPQGTGPDEDPNDETIPTPSAGHPGIDLSPSGCVRIVDEGDDQAGGLGSASDSSDERDKMRQRQADPAAIAVTASCWQREMNTDGDAEGITDEDAEEGDLSSLEAADLGQLIEDDDRAIGTFSGRKTRRPESPIELIAPVPPVTVSDNAHKQWRASSLPRTKMTDFMEAMVAEQLRSYGFADIIPSVTIRMASNTDQHVEVPEPIVDNMSTAEGRRIPSILGYRQKCVLLFQNIDGVDVCLFCLYVQEFGEACPAPNKSVVYVSYLDSVDYFRPIEARTLVYHEIMVGYMKWVQTRGFKQAHIWSCPPQRGDNFIFWCHPAHQRTPSRDRLNMWYNEMLLRASKLGVIHDMDNMFGAYFSQYMKKERDETTIRSSAARSYVGAGNVKGKGKGKGQGKGPPMLTVDTSFGQANATGKVELKEEQAPVCPPVFEGDFWVNECLRVHRSVISRSRGDDGQERDVNKRKAREMLKTLSSMQCSGLFSKPVDADALGIADYHTIIKKPMDLGTVRDKLRKDCYGNMLDLAEDIRLVFNNALTFNPPGHWICAAALNLLGEFEKMLHEMATSFSGGVVEPGVEHVNKLLPLYPLLGSLLHQDADSSLGSPRGLGHPMERTVSSGLPPCPLLQRATSFDSCASTIGITEDGDNYDGHTTGRRDSHFDDNDSSMFMDFEDPESPRNATGSIRRQDSLESVAGASEHGDREGGEFIASRRPTHSGAMLGALPDSVMLSHLDVPFEKPGMGFKGSMSMMNELAKCVDRLKVDLFVIRFAAPGPVLVDKSASSRGAKRVKLDPNDIDNVPMSRSSSVTEEIAAAADRAQAPKKSKGYRGKAGAYLRRIASGAVEDLDEFSIAEQCLSLLQGIPADTSDPDMAFSNPFVDTRHTFLEMCQFRHYQFDTLRRAKHSSLMLLFHLHNPHAPHLRPKCKLCLDSIRDVRWHCGDGCANYDVCENCYHAISHRHPHMPGHKLTPFRVTFA